MFSRNICHFKSKYKYNLTSHIKTQNKGIICIYCEETFGSDLELDKHKMCVHTISIYLETKTEDLHNGRVKVITMQTEEDKNDNCLFFSRSLIVKNTQKRKAVENQTEDNQLENIKCQKKISKYIIYQDI